MKTLLHSLAFTLALLAASDASADEVRFRLMNGTNYPIRELAVSASDLATWGPNVIGRPSIKPGDTREVVVRGMFVDCNVDMKVVFDTIDTQPIWQYLNLCNLKTVRFNYDNMSGITTASYDE